MADSLQHLGKIMLGWDEVVSAGLPNKSRVMWWRHDQPKMLDLALKNGYEVILCPRIPLYFDFVQNESHKSGRKWAGKFASIESVYEFPSEKFMGGVNYHSPLVKGIQANLWTEMMHSNDRLEFMIFPRLSALAESAWTNQNRKNFTDFQNRMKNILDFYQKSGLRYFDLNDSERSKEITGPAKP